MHTSHIVSSLYLCIFALLSIFHGVVSTVDAVPSAQLLPDGFFAFGNYEVLSTHERGDEDVVHIRKRAEEGNCKSDCLTYSGWEEDGIMRCEPEDEDEEVENAESKRSLWKRGRKPIEAVVCPGFTINGLPQSPFHLVSPTWDTPTKLEKKHKDNGAKRVYDSGDPRKPLESAWFELERLDTRWSSGGVGVKRCYHAEHVLEWQMLTSFLEEDKADPNSRCEYMHQYFTQPIKLDNHKVKVAKKDGELDSKDRFVYEDKLFEFSKWKASDTKLGGDLSVRIIDYVSAQWPGKSTSAPPNPWEYEMVLLMDIANIKKENVWSKKTMINTPEPGKENLPNKENSFTMQWLFENRYAEKQKEEKWADNKGTCRAVHQFMTLMLIAQYHNDPYIKEVMRAQVMRVGDAFEYVEDEILPQSAAKPAVKRGLKKEWIEYMKKQHKESLEAFQKELDDNVKIFDPRSPRITKLRRWDYSGVFKREITFPDCGTEKDKQKMAKRVQLLVDAYAKMPRIDTELKLD